MLKIDYDSIPHNIVILSSSYYCYLFYNNVIKLVKLLYIVILCVIFTCSVYFYNIDRDYLHSRLGYAAVILIKRTALSGDRGPHR